MKYKKKKKKTKTEPFHGHNFHVRWSNSKLSELYVVLHRIQLYIYKQKKHPHRKWLILQNSNLTKQLVAASCTANWIGFDASTQRTPRQSQTQIKHKHNHSYNRHTATRQPSNGMAGTHGTRPDITTYRETQQQFTIFVILINWFLCAAVSGCIADHRVFWCGRKHVFNFLEIFVFRLRQYEVDIHDTRQWCNRIEEAYIEAAQFDDHRRIQFNAYETDGVRGANGESGPEATVLLREYFGVHGERDGEQTKGAGENVGENERNWYPAPILHRVFDPCGQTEHAWGHQKARADGWLATAQLIQQQSDQATGQHTNNADVDHAQERIHGDTGGGAELGCIHDNHKNTGQLLECKETNHNADGTMDLRFAQGGPDAVVLGITHFALLNQNINFTL